MDLDPIRRGRFLQFKILGDAVLDYCELTESQRWKLTSSHD